jgi:hypothetical protein
MTRLAEARLSASIITSCSMMKSLMLIPPGTDTCDCITNASVPRTDSANRAYSSPLLNCASLTSPTRIPR